MQIYNYYRIYYNNILSFFANRFFDNIIGSGGRVDSQSFPPNSGLQQTVGYSALFNVLNRRPMLAYLVFGIIKNYLALSQLDIELGIA